MGNNSGGAESVMSSCWFETGKGVQARAGCVCVGGGGREWKHCQSSDLRFHCGVINEIHDCLSFLDLVLSSVKGENELSVKNEEEHPFVCQC